MSAIEINVTFFIIAVVWAFIGSMIGAWTGYKTDHHLWMLWVWPYMLINRKKWDFTVIRVNPKRPIRLDPRGHTGRIVPMDLARRIVRSKNITDLPIVGKQPHRPSRFTNCYHCGIVLNATMTALIKHTETKHKGRNVKIYKNVVYKRVLQLSKDGAWSAASIAESVYMLNLGLTFTEKQSIAIQRARQGSHEQPTGDNQREQGCDNSFLRI